ncbi:pyridoxal-dependent decarboxylase [Myxococcus sp. K15C18031901]|uniref:pyridoxal phosphate-dependent decarboxylase family protein n=1 Tax=Myxococcus dinghuensis TaxID=2906761 RepID=UPI0020A6E06A|nr:pyridoxal-dependent decarboxylase [Myxococcus dinghuensis]MCP3097910.1 pyridoxal-dependent decarboxylase [Myxococcus dinghuensis]
MQTEADQGNQGAEMAPRWPRRPSAVLAGTREGLAAVSAALTGAVGSALAIARWPTGPLRAGTPREVLAAATKALGGQGIPEEGMGGEAALARLGRVMVEYGLHLSHAHAVAHLQPPPLTVAVAADALASASNASLDTYDSGPSAIAIERWLIDGLVSLAGLGAKADGVLTPGGSMSNLLGLLLARDASALRRGVDARRQGVGLLPNPVVFCSELAHFSVQRACAALGLGEDAVRLVPTDSRRRMRPDALATLLETLPADHTPLAIVATAGTTDFGSIDPLPRLAELAARHGVWFHVDAAYGFGALFSERLAGRLEGLALADSITLDLHKLGWQPAATSVLLVSDAQAFSALDREVAYLNPVDDADAGYEGLLGRSLQTTRRPDAVKVAATLLAFGRRGLGDMVDTCHDLARYAEQRIATEPALELVSPAELTTVVFRFRCEETPAREDDLNGELRRRLMETGVALIGRTAVRLDGPDSPARVCLKFTLLNPTTTPEDLDALVDAVLAAGRACTSRHQQEVA